MAAAVSRQRTIGLETMPRSGSPASRSPSRATCSRPRSSSRTPGDRPASTPAVLAVVRPCLTKMTVAMAPE